LEIKKNDTSDLAHSNTSDKLLLFSGVGLMGLILYLTASDMYNVITHQGSTRPGELSLEHRAQLQSVYFFDSFCCECWQLRFLSYIFSSSS